MTLHNSKGQALIESLFTLPLAILVVSSIFMGFFYLSCEFLVDHWTYQGALCLASHKPVVHCRAKLKDRLQLLPLYHHDIQKMDRRNTRVDIMIFLSGPFMQRKVFSESLRLPLQAKDFQRAL